MKIVFIFFERRLSPCRYMRSLAPERLNGFYSHSFFKSLSFIGGCPVNINNPNPKAGAFQGVTKTQNCNFHESGCNIFG
jgi:hypothetical protein